MENSYKLHFQIKEYTSSKDKDFFEALKIYNDNISVDIKTSTNDIIYFVDNRKSQKNREMFFFGLYTNDILMGFVMAGYLVISKTIIIDYIILKKEYHLNSIFYPLFSLIQQYFSDALIDYDYIVTEVSDKCPEEAIDVENFFSKKMLQMEDFRLINQLYIQPKLGLKNEESNTPFQLMIKSTQAISKLKGQTYLSIVKDIYYEHYLAWYQIVEAENADLYAKHIEQQYKIIEKNLNNVSDIDLIMQNPICSFYKAPDCHYNSTAGFIPQKDETKDKPVLLLSIPLIIVVSFGISYFLYLLLNKLNINSQVFAAVFAATTALCAGIVAIAFQKASKK